MHMDIIKSTIKLNVHHAKFRYKFNRKLKKKISNKKMIDQVEDI